MTVEFKYCKMEIYVPQSHAEDIFSALKSQDAGHIGGYDCCLSYSTVTSRWRPLRGASPYIGEVGSVSVEPEVKIEAVCMTQNVDSTIKAVKEAHPYEEPVINVIPLYKTSF